MDIYSIFRPAIFSLDPETAHNLSLKLLKLAYNARATSLIKVTSANKPLTIMGLDFKNPVGLAAGMDKNGDYIDALSALGFGFIEVGTITPQPQPGNPKPRLFRLPEHQAIINRMGFNNLGIDHLIHQLKTTAYKGILGINIGKNFDTPIKNASSDYLIGLRKSYALASYITLNISSPNTKNLRQLQQADEIKKLLSVLKEEQLKLQQIHKKYTPLVVKIAPDLEHDEITHIARLLLEFNIDGVIASNTTISREAVPGHIHAKEAGGLSGVPLKQLSTRVITSLASALNGQIPIIAVGGILNSKDAQDKLNAGASLVQIYTGLVYRGPQLIEEILQDL